MVGNDDYSTELKRCSVDVVVVVVVVVVVR
jgi:hypothetical protein